MPGPGRVPFQAALANFNPHFDNDERPLLLLIAGGADHIEPAALPTQPRPCW